MLLWWRRPGSWGVDAVGAEVEIAHRAVFDKRAAVGVGNEEVVVPLFSLCGYGVGGTVQGEESLYVQSSRRKS